MLENVEATQNQGGTLSELTAPNNSLMVVVRNVDEKGRVLIPHAIREALGDEFVSYHGRKDTEILLYSSMTFSGVQERLIESMGSLSGFESRIRERLFYSRVNECSFDSVGRFNLSSHHRSSETIPTKVEITWDRVRDFVRVTFLGSLES